MFKYNYKIGIKLPIRDFHRKVHFQGCVVSVIKLTTLDTRIHFTIPPNTNTGS